MLLEEERRERIPDTGDKGDRGAERVGTERVVTEA